MGQKAEGIIIQLEEVKSKLDDLTPIISALRKEFFAPDATEEIKQNLKDAEEKGQQLLDKLGSLTDQLQELLGIPEEALKAIEESEINAGAADHYDRASLSSQKIKPTSDIDAILPKALEEIIKIVDKKWLQQEKEKKYRLDDEFLRNPLSIVRGVRLESEISPVHKFAKGILVSEDYMAAHSGYDFFAGALLIPQLVSLATKLPALSDVTGNVQERVDALWKSSSEISDATTYELLVASSCAIKGRKIELLETTHEKSPEMRVHDYGFPMIIECKRKQILTAYEKAEESHMRKLYYVLSGACQKKGLSGIFILDSKIECAKLPVDEIVECGTRQRLSYSPRKPTVYAWGSIAFKELPDMIDMTTIKLYSPDFLLRIFGWNFDMPMHDGIICSVEEPDNIFVNRVKDPLALIWTVSSEEAIKKRARTVSSLYAQAIKQVPLGESGIIYVCYQEGTRPEVADNRTKYLEKELKAWYHQAGIRIPIAFITRLYPRPLAGGQPDLIESTLRVCSELYGEKIMFTDFPAAVFTK